MSKTGRSNYRRRDREQRHQAKLERRIYVRAVRREQPDIRLLGKAFLALALAEAARAAEAEKSRTEKKEADHADK
ncbi:hypothetical protein IU459_16105 [Nocardia amamiensis]|uniref:Uncharacterized protein n=1 Tax=Nocardia amamiensis TaxID=404578 RepID=A0ABS0CW80_9NOCA|nr:hypothetical protein [Nocardia amamiensis]MBF6299053.1 hypothetical protein [Nocardia amamiensis]